MFIAEGYFYDTAGKLLTGVTIQLVQNSTGVALSEPYLVETANYSAWTDLDPYQISVTFTKKGYVTQKIQIAVLEEHGDVILKKSGSNTLLYGGLAAVVYVAAVKHKKQTGKIGALSSGDIYPIFLAVGGFIAIGVVTRLLEKLGLMDSQATKALDGLSQDPNSFWNVNFWRNLPAGQSYHNPITQSQAQQYAAQIYDAIGPVNDDEESIKAVFKGLHTQANASFICWAFSGMYGEDLLSWLRGGVWPQDRLSDADVYEINKFVTKLPKY